MQSLCIGIKEKLLIILVLEVVAVKWEELDYKYQFIHKFLLLPYTLYGCRPLFVSCVNIEMIHLSDGLIVVYSVLSRGKVVALNVRDVTFKVIYIIEMIVATRSYITAQRSSVCLVNNTPFYTSFAVFFSLFVLSKVAFLSASLQQPCPAAPPPPAEPSCGRRPANTSASFVGWW